jgi:hypothetical protein
MRKPGDPDPDSVGGRAAERLREFLEKRRPQTRVAPDGDEPAETPETPGPLPSADADKARKRDASQPTKNRS